MIKRIITLSLLSSAFAFGQQAPAPGTPPPGYVNPTAPAPGTLPPGYVNPTAPAPGTLPPGYVNPTATAPGTVPPGQPYPAAPVQPYPAATQAAPGQPYPAAAPVPGQPYPAAAPVPGQPYPAAPGQPYPAAPGQPYPAAAPVPGQPYPADAPFPGEPHDGHDHQQEEGIVFDAGPDAIMVETEPDGDIITVSTDDYSEIVFITAYDELDPEDFEELKGKRVMVIIGQRPDGSSAVDHIEVHEEHDDDGDAPDGDYPPAIDPATGSAPIPPG
jgi:hypothetical protein